MKQKANLNSNHKPKLNKSASSKEAKKPKSKKQKIFGIVAKTLSILSALALLALLINIYRFNILPMHLAIIITVIVVLLAGINIFLAFFKKKEKILKTISIILSILYSAVAIFGFVKINDTINFLSTFGTDKTTNTYNVLVATESELNEDSDLSGYEINTYQDLMLDSNLVSDAISSEFNASAVFTSDLPELINYGLEDTNHVISMNAGAYESFIEDNDTYKDRFRIIKTFEIITDANSSSNIDVTNTPFAVYLSGIDTRSGALPSRSLSDVNIVAVINPVEHKVLLVSIPRDYYVHLHGTTEADLNDKLTHAGSMGGVELSKATIEDLLDLKIDFYARVNFNFVQNLVDAIGGINIYSDVDYSFSCKADRGCVFNPGNNFVDGRCALAFARERKAYSNGDRHRGENQEQVISLILNKITSSSTLLSSYSDILASLDGTFETSFNMDDITKFFRKQLEDMPSWTVENQNLDGTGGSAPTYSYPAQNLSIIYQDQASIDAAKAKIAEILGTATDDNNDIDAENSANAE